MPDLVAGWVLGTALLAFGLVWGDEAEKFAIFHPLGGLVVVLVSVAMVCLYPVPDKVGRGGGREKEVEEGTDDGGGEDKRSRSCPSH
jgi:hypothetical protein